MSHGDRVTAVPAGFDVVATSKNCPISAMANNAEKLYGLQFHTEVRNTEYGLDILKKFAFDVCGCQGQLVNGRLHRHASRRRFAKPLAIRRSSWAFPAGWTPQ